VQTTGSPPTQEPDWHASVWVHALPSSQGLPAAVGVLIGTPLSQTSSVQGLLSSMGIQAVPPVPLLLVEELPPVPLLLVEELIPPVPLLLLVEELPPVPPLLLIVELLPPVPPLLLVAVPLLPPALVAGLGSLLQPPTATTIPTIHTLHASPKSFPMWPRLPARVLSVNKPGFRSCRSATALGD
jgi:hypothetical protein